MADGGTVKGSDRFFRIEHGNLTVSVPYGLFKGRTAILDEGKVWDFRRLLCSRYPWLSRNALDVIVENAMKERQDQISREQTSARNARTFIESGNPEKALTILNDHLGRCPEDAEALYAKGEALCRLGRTEEGYQCISKARRITIG